VSRPCFEGAAALLSEGAGGACRRASGAPQADGFAYQLGGGCFARASDRLWKPCRLTGPCGKICGHGSDDTAGSRIAAVTCGVAAKISLADD
jgi:hypothetical protein